MIHCLPLPRSYHPFLCHSETPTLPVSGGEDACGGVGSYSPTSYHSVLNCGPTVNVSVPFA